MSPARTTGLFRLLFAGALLTASWLALTPSPVDLTGVSHGDKWAHLAAYLTLALLLDLGWPAHGFGLRKWGFLLAYGLAIEAIQSTIPNRFFSTYDLAANAAGIAAYSIGLLPLLRSRGLRPRSA